MHVHFSCRDKICVKKRAKQKLMSVMPHAESVTEYFFLSTMRIIANQNMISSVLAARKPFFFLKRSFDVPVITH